MSDLQWNMSCDEKCHLFLHKPFHKNILPVLLGCPQVTDIFVSFSLNNSQKQLQTLSGTLKWRLHFSAVHEKICPLLLYTIPVIVIHIIIITIISHYHIMIISESHQYKLALGLQSSVAMVMLMTADAEYNQDNHLSSSSRGSLSMPLFRWHRVYTAATTDYCQCYWFFSLLPHFSQRTFLLPLCLLFV